MALRYVLSHPAVSTVIPGMRSVRNVERNIADGEACPMSRLSASSLTAGTATSTLKGRGPSETGYYRVPALRWRAVCLSGTTHHGDVMLGTAGASEQWSKILR